MLLAFILATQQRLASRVGPNPCPFPTSLPGKGGVPPLRVGEGLGVRSFPRTLVLTTEISQGPNSCENLLQVVSHFVVPHSHSPESPPRKDLIALVIVVDSVTVHAAIDLYY